MIYFRYDKTFEGLLCCVFAAYSQKCFPNKLLHFNDPVPVDVSTLITLLPEQPSLFAPVSTEQLSQNISTDTIQSIPTLSEQANRVWKGVQKKISPEAAHSITTVWLSELPSSDELIFRYIQKVLDYKGNSIFAHAIHNSSRSEQKSSPNNTPSCPASIELNFADPDVLEMTKIFKKVTNERLRIIQFMRFQKALDGTYFAPISPIYNVLPLTLNHFTNRFHDQEWIIYDLHRNYGYYYNMESTKEITFENAPELLSGELVASGEDLYSQLWQAYFKAVCIKERINPRLHLQHLPARFWKHLTEKR